MPRPEMLFAAALASSLSFAALAAVDDVRPVKLAPVHRVNPEFPRAAKRVGTEKGVVTARMTLDGNGKVTQVEIVQSEPRRLFDQAVTQALSQWRYPEGRAGRVVEVEVGFKQ